MCYEGQTLAFESSALLNQLRYRITTYVELRLVIGTVVEEPKAVAELP
jgi:hypothetical protein